MITNWHLYALDKVSTLKIYHHLFSVLTQKEKASVYVKDKKYIEVFKVSNTIILATNPTEADIVLITDESMLDAFKNKNLNKKCIFLTTNYRYLKRSEKIVGALYWRKGRSQLLFIKRRLERLHIVLPKSYQKFVIEEL
jgi:hypothetical protein